jgi:hypothetical protein
MASDKRNILKKEERGIVADMSGRVGEGEKGRKGDKRAE